MSWCVCVCVCAEVDETHIPQYRIMHQGKAVLGEGAQEDHRCERACN